MEKLEKRLELEGFIRVQFYSDGSGGVFTTRQGPKGDEELDAFDHIEQLGGILESLLKL